MYQYGIEKENNVVFIDEKGQLTNRKNNQDSFDIISLSNTIELLKEDKINIEKKISANFKDLLYNLFLYAGFVGLAGFTASFLVEELFLIILICSFSLSICASISSIKDFKEYGKDLFEEFSKKDELLTKYKTELANIKKTEMIRLVEKPTYAYVFDLNKAREACKEYVPATSRNYFKRRGLERRR